VAADQPRQEQCRCLRAQLGEHHRNARTIEAGIELALVGAESDGDAAGGDSGGVSQRLAMQRRDNSRADRLQTSDQDFTQVPASWFLTGGSGPSSNSLALLSRGRNYCTRQNAQYQFFGGVITIFPN
jgi:hypothetical protein